MLHAGIALAVLVRAWCMHACSALAKRRTHRKARLKRACDHVQRFENNGGPRDDTKLARTVAANVKRET